MKTYQIPKAMFRQFANLGIPYMNFAQFNNLVQMYRDEYWASQYVEGFMWDVGVKYNVWTRRTVNTYHRHIFFDEIHLPIWIAFEIPNLNKRATIPLYVTLFDDEGLYFTQEQLLVVERIEGATKAIRGWRQIETIRDFLLSECPE